MRQQLLPIQSDELLDFNNYMSSSANKSVIDYLKNIDQNNSTLSGEKMLYLTGKHSSGLTHVLNAAARLHKNFIIISNKNELLAVMDKQKDNLGAIAIDNVDTLLGDLETEKVLFNLYNSVAQQNTIFMYLASHALPSQLNCNLPDLKSRLQALLVLTIQELTDKEKVLALEMRATQRGFALPREVSEYLLNHFPRDSYTLFQSLNKLDNLSLEEKRKLTIPFIKEVFS